MYNDPIVTSSPPPAAGTGRTPARESPDVLAAPYITQPTQPYNPFALSHPAHAALPSMNTQPTQLLSSPQRHRNRVQVPRSSPIAERYSSPPMPMSQSQRPTNPMAPPGTYTLPPPPVARPPLVDLTSDDPPVDPDSQEEDFGGSNIRPSTFEMQSISRVAETPERPSFGANLAASYAYNAHATAPNANNKRPLANGASPRNVRPRQSAPARAMPVVADLEIKEIQNWDHQKKVYRLKAVYPEYTVQQLYDSLLANNADYEVTKATYEAMQKNVDDEDELATSQHFARRPGFALPRGTAMPKGVAQPTAAPEYQPKKTAQRGLIAPIQSIQAKFSTVRREPQAQSQSQSQSQSQVQRSVSASPQKPKRRLIRGPRGKPAPEESDEDEGIRIISSDESDAEVSDEEDLDKQSLLKFFNECSTEAMVDLSSMKEEEIQSVLDKRPFNSLSQIEDTCSAAQEVGKNGKKARKPKITFGKRLVEAASKMWTGFGAVDQLVRQCEGLGKPIAATMATWGVDVFGAAKDGELALTSLETDSTSARDSGLGTPSGAGTPTSIRESDIGKKLSKSTLLKKPSIMSEDIELKDYQVVGLNWLNLLWENGVSGILADDMGLGKTCQVISFLSHLWEQNVPGPHLIVVPGSTLENWLREFEFFSPELKKHVEPYYGSQAARNEQQEAILDNLDDIYCIVTTYDLAYKKEDNKFLRKCKPKACIYDEGHVLRNSDTQRYKSLMRIPADFRLLLTGTPLQNSLRELASILAFIMPDIFSEVQDKLEVVFKHKAKVNEADSHEALLSEQRIQRARSMMTPFILRRKKAQVLKHLPKKTCRVEYCELTTLQQKLYNEQLEQQKQVLLDRAEGKPTKDHANVMMKLRQAAIHPLLFRTHYTDAINKKIAKACLREETLADRDADAIFEDLTYYQDYSVHSLALKYPRHLGRYALKNDEWMDSGKVAKLAELLKAYIANGDRTLIFSQFTSVMDILQWVLDSLDISYSRLDGQTPIVERQALLDQFYEDESISVFMLSTKSGGAGINLACANKVIIFDSSFNPQDDVQAENRAHRVGQTRDVEVVRLVTRGTVEEQIHALGVSKLELDKMVAGEEGEGEKKPAAKGKKKEEKKDGETVVLSKADEAGIEAVERMMLEQLKNQPESEKVVEKKDDAEKEAEDGDKAKPTSTAKGKKRKVEEETDDEPEPVEEDEPKPKRKRLLKKRKAEQKAPESDSEPEPAKLDRPKAKPKSKAKTTAKATPKAPAKPKKDDETPKADGSNRKRKSRHEEDDEEEDSGSPSPKKKKKGASQNGDIRQAFLKGLKKKGLDMSAAK